MKMKGNLSAAELLCFEQSFALYIPGSCNDSRWLMLAGPAILKKISLSAKKVKMRSKKLLDRPSTVSISTPDASLALVHCLFKFGDNCKKFVVLCKFIYLIFGVLFCEDRFYVS